MKVVVNNCYGGFGLSLAAGEALVLAGCDKSLISMTTNTAYWWGRRHDDRLVAVVEAFGASANSECSSLEVLQIDGPYRIVENDGLERIETPSTISWVNG